VPTIVVTFNFFMWGIDIVQHWFGLVMYFTF
jgi:hypothetical protein